MSGIDPRTPVLVGVGSDEEDGEVVDLMTTALRRAGADAGTPRLVDRLDRIMVPQGTWTDADPGRQAARRLGRTGAASWRGAVGISQQALVTEALRSIATGACDVVAVVGGEARAHMTRVRRAGGGEDGAGGRSGGGSRSSAWVAGDEVRPDVVLEREPDFLDQAEIAAGLVQPVAQYAMIENALGWAESIAPDEHRRQVAELWERFNRVAVSTGTGPFSTARSAEEIAVPSISNRALAFPYNKWHASQWTVDQAAALLFCSAATARDAGVPTERWIFPLVGLDASCAVPLSRRRDLYRWPAMKLLGERAAERIGRPLAGIELLEVYSCFPAAVRVQQRELGLPLDGTPTRCGGMTFAGGPFNNFTYQATERILHELRERPAELAAVTTVCGLLTKPGLAVWAGAPDGKPPLLEDLAEDAWRETPVAEVAVGYRGPATIATFTVVPEHSTSGSPGDAAGRSRASTSAEVPSGPVGRANSTDVSPASGVAGAASEASAADPAMGYRDHPARTLIVADLPDGRRTVAACGDPAVALDAVRHGLIGTEVHVDGSTFSR